MSARAALAAVAAIDDMFTSSQRPTDSSQPSSPAASQQPLASSSTQPNGSTGSSVHAPSTAAAPASTAADASSISAEWSTPPSFRPARRGARPLVGAMSVSALRREEARQLREAIELSRQEAMGASGADEQQGEAQRAAADERAEDEMEVDPPSPQPLKRKRGRPSTSRARQSSPSPPPPPPTHVAAALSRSSRRPNYKEASDDDDFDVAAADDEVDTADAEADGADAETAVNDDDEREHEEDEERDEVLQALLIAEGEQDELRRRFRDRVGKGVTQRHLERWFGVGSIPDEFYGLNGWLGRLPAGRILARRFIIGRHSTFTLHGLQEDATQRETNEVDGCFWYLYCFTGKSYLHCRWIPEHHFMHFDDSSGRINHFNKKRTTDELELDVAFIPQQQRQQQQQQQQQQHSQHSGRGGGGESKSRNRHREQLCRRQSRTAATWPQARPVFR